MSLLKKLFGKATTPFDFSSLGVDVHNHFLPSIDDGAQTIAQSIEMLKKMEQLGYRKIVMTPHIYPGLYENDNDSILTAFKSVVNEQHQFPLLKLNYAAEYYFEESLFDKITQKELLTFYGNHVLFEFSFQNKPNRIDDLIFELNANGYTGVLAQGNYQAIILANGNYPNGAYPGGKLSDGFTNTGDFFGQTSAYAFDILNVTSASTAATAVPEPFTIVGTLIGGATALRMRKRLKATNKL